MKTDNERELRDSFLLDFLAWVPKKEDPEVLEQAISRNRYENNPESLTSYPHSAPIFMNKSPSIFHLGNQVSPSVAN